MWLVEIAYLSCGGWEATESFRKVLLPAVWEMAWQEARAKKI